MNTLIACNTEGNKSGYVACDCTDATLLEHLFDDKVVLSEVERRGKLMLFGVHNYTGYCLNVMHH